MASPAGPIYASSLHRRDRVWGTRRRGGLRLAVRAFTWAVTLAACGLLLAQYLG